MSDITSTHLEAAIIDQTVAGELGERPYAFISVYNDHGWILGVAIANEDGYKPLVGKTFVTEAESRQWAKGLNEHIRLSPNTVAEIICSTMGGRTYYAPISSLSVN